MHLCGMLTGEPKCGNTSHRPMASLVFKPRFFGAYLHGGISSTLAEIALRSWTLLVKVLNVFSI